MPLEKNSTIFIYICALERDHINLGLLKRPKSINGASSYNTFIAPCLFYTATKGFIQRFTQGEIESQCSSLPM